MRRRLYSRMGSLSRPRTAALVVAGSSIAWLLSEVHVAGGPFRPAGLFFAVVLVVNALGGATAGLVTTAIGAIVIGSRFTDDPGSLSFDGRHTTTDLLAFIVVSVVVTLLLGRLTEARSATQQALAQVAAVVQNAPIGIGFVDRDLRVVELNDSLAAMTGRHVAEMLGRLVDDLPDVRDTEIPDAIRDVLRTGESRLDVALVGRNGRYVAGYYPVRAADGSITGVGILVREVSAERQRDLLIDRVTRLQELTASLSVAGTVDEVVDTAVRSIHHAVDAHGVSFCCVDGAAIRVAGSIGYSESVAAAFASFPLDAPVPIAEAIRSGAPVLCPTLADSMQRFPQLRSAMALDASRAIAALPLRGESAVFGAIGISFDDDRGFDPDEVSFLVATATQCATAYERAIAFEAEREARRAVEDANRRLEYLSSATAVLAQSLDPATTMQRLAELAVPTLSDWCAVHLVDGEFAYPVAMASENPETTALVRDLSERHPIPLDAPAGLGAVARTGEPVVVRSVTMDAVRASTQEGEVVDLLSRLRSIAIVPMIFQGRVLGTVTLSNTTDRDLDDSDVKLASELAARAAQAVTNARLFQERTLVASTLQASLLPPSPTLIPGADVATRFVPAAEGLEVGGDFYDVFRLGTVDRPAPTWALVIGDVRGKGAAAAAITGIARATIRAAALDETSPAAMLRRLNQVLLAAAEDDHVSSQTGEPRFCTACVVTVTPTPDGADLVVAMAGHPRPYVVRSDGEADQVGVHGGLIGVFSDPDLVDDKVHLGPGDALVLYTDGVTERHEGRVFFDEEGLASVLAGCSGATASGIADRVERAARAFVPSKPKDDLAIVVARIPDPAADGTMARTILPADERAAAIARRFVVDALRTNVNADVTDTAVLLTSELVTNALLHGTPSIRVDVVAVPEGIRISVTDEHPDLPTRLPAGAQDEHGRGLLLVDALSTSWGVDTQPTGKAVWFDLSV